MRNLLLIAGAALAVSSPVLAAEGARHDRTRTVVTAAGVAGSVAGSSVAGPVGGFVGGALGKAVAQAATRRSEPSAAAAPAEAPLQPSLTPEQRTAMAVDAPPAWADPGQALRQQHAAPPPARAAGDAPN